MNELSNDPIGLTAEERSGLAKLFPGTPTKAEDGSEEIAAAEQPETTQTPDGGATGEAQATPDATTPPEDSELEGFPEELKVKVKQLIESKEKGFKSAFTKKTQELAAERKQVEGLELIAKQTGLSPDQVATNAKAFAQLQAMMANDPQVVIARRNGDQIQQVLFGGQPEARPEFNTPDEAIAWAEKHYEAKLDVRLKELEQRVEAKYKPVVESVQKQSYAALGDAWRKQNADISDEELKTFVQDVAALQEALSQRDADPAAYLSMMKEKLIPSIRARRAATVTPKPKVTPQVGTAIPKTTTRTPSKKVGDDPKSILEEVAKGMGMNSLSELEKAFQ